MIKISREHLGACACGDVCHAGMDILSGRLYKALSCVLQHACTHTSSLQATHPVNMGLCQMRLLEKLSCKSRTRLICSHHTTAETLYIHLQHAVCKCDFVVFATRPCPLYCINTSSAAQPAESDCKTVDMTGAIIEHTDESAASAAAARAAACNATGSFIGLHQCIGVASITASLLSRQPSQLSSTSVCGQWW